jgi:DNA-binding transcriptional ArsR family regulator
MTLAGQPTSVSLAFSALQSKGSAMRLDEICSATGMKARTLRFALRRLRELGLAESVRGLRDARIAFWRLRGVP